VIPTYNRKTLLQRAINSILAQTYQNWLVCIVDDGSSDGTAAMMQQFSHEPRIHYIEQSSNQGVNAARNRALDYLIEDTKCDFITFLDDDDYFDKNMLDEAQRIVTAHPNKNWYVSKRVDENGNDITRMDHLGPMPYINYYLGITMDHDATHLINAETIGKTRFSKEFKQAEEWVFYMELSTKTEMYTYDFPSTICRYLDDGLSAQAKQIRDERSLAIEQRKEETLKRIGYKPATLETMKLRHRIDQTLQNANYLKLLRYGPRYLFWKIKEYLT